MRVRVRVGSKEWDYCRDLTDLMGVKVRYRRGERAFDAPYICDGQLWSEAKSRVR